MKLSMLTLLMSMILFTSSAQTQQDTKKDTLSTRDHRSEKYKGRHHGKSGSDRHKHRHHGHHKKNHGHENDHNRGGDRHHK
jgi:Ni/Co efflux regulator RcnB